MNRLLFKYFMYLKSLIYQRKKKEEMILDDFEHKCFYEETWNYLI